MKFYKKLGKIIYILSYPGIRLMLWRSNRVYLLIKYNNQIFVTKNWLGLHKKWRLPGGGLKNQEELSVAVLRELKEELGYKPETTPKLITPKPIKSPIGYKYSLFSLELKSRPDFYVNYKEIVEHSWISLENLPNHLCSEELNYVKSKLL